MLKVLALGNRDTEDGNIKLIAEGARPAACEKDQQPVPEAPYQVLLTRVTKHPQVKRVILHDSRAKGNYRLGCDIDLTLVGDNLSYARLCRIETEIDELLPYSLDLSLYAQIDNADLRDHIQRVEQVFYPS